MIYIKTDKKFNSVKELFDDFYCYKTAYKENLKPKKTYSDPECTTLQCVEKKIRSFDNLHELILTYFPEMELKDVVHEIITYTPSFKYVSPDSSERNYVFYPASCSDIQLITVWYNRSFNSPESHFTEFGAKRRSKHSWNELLGLLGIKTTKELANYIRKHHAENAR